MLSREIKMSLIGENSQMALCGDGKQRNGRGLLVETHKGHCWPKESSHCHDINSFQNKVSQFQDRGCDEYLRQFTLIMHPIQEAYHVHWNLLILPDKSFSPFCRKGYLLFKFFLFLTFASSFVIKAFSLSSFRSNFMPKSRQRNNGKIDY